MVVLILVPLLALILGGAGFAVHVLRWVAGCGAGRGEAELAVAR
jgi:hypothetical protein